MHTCTYVHTYMHISALQVGTVACVMWFIESCVCFMQWRLSNMCSWSSRNASIQLPRQVGVHVVDAFRALVGRLQALLRLIETWNRSLHQENALWGAKFGATGECTLPKRGQKHWCRQRRESECDEASNLSCLEESKIDVHALQCASSNINYRNDTDGDNNSDIKKRRNQ